MDEIPRTSDTPPDHTVLGLEIDESLLPEWFDAVKGIAARLARRMSVMEKPGTWILRVELADERVEAFNAALATHWQAFVETRKGQGRWDVVEPGPG